MGFKGALGRKAGLGSKGAPSQPPVTPAATQSHPPPPAQVAWDAKRFKIQLKMAKGRMEIQRGKKDNEINSTRQQIAEHLNAGKDPLARILCERVLREKNTVDGFDIMTTYVELLGSSHTVFSVQRDFDATSTDIKESVASIVYASTRMNLPELHQVTNMFSSHFGAHVIEPIGRREGNNVQYINKLLAAKLEGGTPDGYLILEELSTIAKEHNLSWIPPPEPEAVNYGGGSGNFGSGGGGGGPSYYVPAPHPTNIPPNASAPPFDYASAPPMNIPGPSYSNMPPFPGGGGMPPQMAAAPFDPSSNAPGTLYPSAPPSFDPYATNAPPGAPPGSLPSAPPSAPPPLDQPHGPGGLDPLPPPSGSYMDDDALERKFRNFQDNQRK